jgi:anthranilate synthase component 1|tara:strand:- start:713 stop:2110 length:1398 start_codon:yes stop_codon:yes gene_type:complete
VKKYLLKTYSKKFLVDTITPVSVYLRIRDKFHNSLLLESSDYNSNNNSFSYICFNQIAKFEVFNNEIIKQFPDNIEVRDSCTKDNILKELETFINSFEINKDDLPFINNGLFGFTAYDAVQYFEDIKITKKNNSISIPEMYYGIYKNIIAIDHFKNIAYIFCHSDDNTNNIDEIYQIIKFSDFNNFKFRSVEKVKSNLSDKEFINHVTKAKKHCKRGDVFQLVLSRRFSQKFSGDDFNVYRALRSINPSPYLFYFDYGNFKIFGSSPEAQLVIKNKYAEIHPIAGTFKRTGDDTKDKLLAEKLMNDPKEVSEHVMLVDLARNDLSRNCRDVKVNKFKEIQFFSHVIHLVSKVTGQLEDNTKNLNIIADTFPAGTLSGAPKHMAMSLIDKYEKTNRGYYGGAIGFLDFQGNFNHAIMIRTFLSKNNCLHWQAGAGIVDKSNNINELNEVYNKLNALTKSIEMANNI